MLFREEEVKAGIAVLDKHLPDWRDNINTEILNLRKLECCILGQQPFLYGVEEDYDYGKNEGTFDRVAKFLYCKEEYGHYTYKWLCEHGFDVFPQTTEGYSLLTETWLALM